MFDHFDKRIRRKVNLCGKNNSFNSVPAFSCALSSDIVLASLDSIQEATCRFAPGYAASISDTFSSALSKLPEYI